MQGILVLEKLDKRKKLDCLGFINERDPKANKSQGSLYALAA
jgi:hypothetical protein